jgi:predicted nucleic acid-binding protein
MILPDANLILYAYDLDSPFHGVAADWWTKCLSNAEPVGLAKRAGPRGQSGSLATGVPLA